MRKAGVAAAAGVGIGLAIVLRQQRREARRAVLAKVFGPQLSARIHDLLSAAVERGPDRIAVVDGERKLSYAELDTRSSENSSISSSLVKKVVVSS